MNLAIFVDELHHFPSSSMILADFMDEFYKEKIFT